MLDWMVWTRPVAIFFAAIALMLAGMTLWEIRRPSVRRKGFLPIATTRGDRLFVGLLGAAYLHLAWVGLSGWVAERLELAQEPSLWFATALAAVWLAVVMRRG